MCCCGTPDPLRSDPKLPHSQTIFRQSEILRGWGHIVLIPCDTVEKKKKASVQVLDLSGSRVRVT